MATTTAPATLDRTTSTPFLLRLYYRQTSFHRPDEFAPNNAAGGSALPPHVHVHTWPTCSLRELALLLAQAVPADVLPSPQAGTRVAFRLVFPDTRRSGGPGPGGGAGPARFVAKEMGSVVIGAVERDDEEEKEEGAGEGVDGAGEDTTPAEESTKTGNVRSDGPTAAAPPEHKDEPARHPRKRRKVRLSAQPPRFTTRRVPADDDNASATLASARFVVGDFISCAIFPPLADGSVAPPPPPPPPPPLPPPSAAAFGAGGRRPPPANEYAQPSRPPRENGYGGGGADRYGGGGGYGRPGGGGGRRSYDGGRLGAGGMPHGEWRRGEMPPGDGGYGSQGGGYYGRGRGRGRW
ncbi:Sin3 associated polypeptide p18-domain-containing protein [Lineolata rhizophorae]|uniref:Sin3 associated polypeptide p18-domain-containing protein n=1 Tax=Lineolata rhizophorae TaxID=578093 RepID=A0A6A6PE67_9PEZI|nr:Sin3 associated polypeptide p18-domain-containing protein [Lineolata rhizophorae]